MTTVSATKPPARNAKVIPLSEASDRDKKVAKLYAENKLTLIEIGEMFEISKQRVDQIRRRLGVPTRGYSENGLKSAVMSGATSGERVSKAYWAKKRARRKIDKRKIN